VILDITIIVLLLVVIALQIVFRGKSSADETAALLKRAAEEQRDSVQKQIAAGATEQFERFGLIQKSVEDTLRASREETNEQL